MTAPTPQRPSYGTELGLPSDLVDVEEDQPRRLVDLATEESEDDQVLKGQRIHVELEDGTEFTVRVTNRDYIRWDKTAPKRKWGNFRDVPFRFATFLAWSAANRDGLTPLTFEQFEEAALEVDRLEQTAEDAARPTQ